MKPLFLPLLLSTLGLALFAAPSRAQTGQGTGPPPLGTPVMATFTIPADTDPDSVTFTSSGQTFAITDQTDPITGQLLTPFGNGGGGGLNIFAAVPGPVGNINTTIPIVEVDFFTTYTGPISLTSLSGFSSFDPWFAETLNPPVGQGFRFYKTLSTQANINTTNPGIDPTEYAFFTLTPAINDPTFLASTFTITGYTSVQNVPEPGTFALLGGLVVTGGMAWRRRRANIAA